MRVSCVRVVIASGAFAQAALCSSDFERVCLFVLLLRLAAGPSCGRASESGAGQEGERGAGLQPSRPLRLQPLSHQQLLQRQLGQLLLHLPGWSVRSPHPQH